MITNDNRSRRRPQGKVDFTFMYAAHDAFHRTCGALQLGLRGGAELFPWMLHGAPADTGKRVLGLLPPPARLLYRAVWRPGYDRTPRWDTATTTVRTERPTP